MTDAAALPQTAPQSNAATAQPEAMAWDSKARRMVTLYLPLACFVVVLLFPFYWMTVTALKPNDELYDYKTHNPLLGWPPNTLTLTFPQFRTCPWA